MASCAAPVTCGICANPPCVAAAPALSSCRVTSCAPCDMPENAAIAPWAALVALFRPEETRPATAALAQAI